MTRRNRVTPFSELVAVPERGMFMGNRGVLHDDEGGIVRFSQVRRWICCLTAFKGRRRPLMTPGSYTELFFLDEATALAAGHRPCFECRRADGVRFREAWAEAAGREASIGADALDRVLHDDRLESPGRMRRWSAATASLPDGTMASIDGAAHLVHAGGLREWTPGGYRAARSAPPTVEVLTARTIVGAITAGYAPALHDSAAS